MADVKQLGYMQRCTSSRWEAALPPVGPREINNAMRAQVIAHFIEMKFPFSLRRPGMLFDSAAAYKGCPPQIPFFPGPPRLFSGSVREPRGTEALIIGAFMANISLSRSRYTDYVRNHTMGLPS
jgi:hypothetical protein